MTTRLHRAFPTDLSVRAEGDGRTIFGIAAPFDSPAEIRDWSGEYVETIQRGAFAKTIADRANKVRLLVQHDRQALPIGRATLLREDPAGLFAEFRVSETPRGDEVLALIRDGALDGLSIGFRIIREEWSDDHKQRSLLEIALHEISAVTFPAYADAAIAGVRSIPSPRIQAHRRALDLLRTTEVPR